MIHFVLWADNLYRSVPTSVGSRRNSKDPERSRMPRCNAIDQGAECHRFKNQVICGFLLCKFPFGLDSSIKIQAGHVYRTEARVDDDRNSRRVAYVSRVSPMGSSRSRVFNVSVIDIFTIR